MRQYALVYGLVYPAHIEFSVGALVLSVLRMLKMMMIHLWDGHDCSARSG